MPEPSFDQLPAEFKDFLLGVQNGAETSFTEEDEQIAVKYWEELDQYALQKQEEDD